MASRTKKSHGGSSASSKSDNKSLLLARGWTARLSLPSNLQPLRPDEMEKDLRHMQVYGNAVQAYQQQLYLQMNQGSGATGENGSGPGQSSPLHPPNTSASVVTSLALPVRIDPEEEKRLLNLRKKIVAAEVLREQAEQEWVANQAHYVHMAATLRQAQQERQETLTFLQTTVKQRAAVLAQARLRLQMTRDVLAVLQYRLAKLEGVASCEKEISDGAAAQSEAKSTAAPIGDSAVNGGNGNDKGAIGANSSAGGLAGEDVLTELWVAAEDEYKRACLVLVGEKEKGANKKKNLAQSIIPWPGTNLTSTPTDVPLFLSILSNIPDKTLAYGGDPESMIWMPFHLAHLYEESRDGDDEDMDDEVDVPEDMDTLDERMIHESNTNDEALHSRVSELEQELTRERQLNTEWSANIAACRSQHDEWVAMMSLIRQETEALLHRHNVLLESDKALEASEQLHEEEMLHEEEENAAKEMAEKEAAAKEEDKMHSPHGTVLADAGVIQETSPPEPTAEATTPAKQAPTPPSKQAPTPDEAANDGDDEGSGGDQEEEEWPATTAADTSATVTTITSHKPSPQEEKMKDAETSKKRLQPESNNNKNDEKEEREDVDRGEICSTKRRKVVE